jgi:hypothetical protein
MSSPDSYWIVCNEETKVCHCDWRVNVRDCFEGNTMHIIYLANAIWSILVVLVGTFSK